MPNDCSPSNASPESLSSTRRKGREVSLAVVIDWSLVSGFAFRVSSSRSELESQGLNNQPAKQELETRNSKLETRNPKLPHAPASLATSSWKSSSRLARPSPIL